MPSKDKDTGVAFHLEAEIAALRAHLERIEARIAEIHHTVHAHGRVTIDPSQGQNAPHVASVPPPQPPGA